MLVKKRVVGFELHSIILYSQSDFFKLHRDSKKKPNHELTISVNAEVKGMKSHVGGKNKQKQQQQNSGKCIGGGIGFPHADIGDTDEANNANREEDEDEDEDDDEDDEPVVIYHHEDSAEPNSNKKKKATASALSAPRQQKTSGLLPCGIWNNHSPGTWAAWFASEPHQVEKMHSGERIAIIYNVLTEEVVENEEDSDVAPSSSNGIVFSVPSKLKKASQMLLKNIIEQRLYGQPMNSFKDRLGVILCHQYSTDGGEEVPRSSLRGRDAKIVSAMENDEIFRFRFAKKNEEEEDQEERTTRNNNNNNDQRKRRHVKLIPIHVIVEQPRFDYGRVNEILQKLTFGTFGRDGLQPPKLSAQFVERRKALIDKILQSEYLTLSNKFSFLPESVQKHVERESEKAGLLNNNNKNKEKTTGNSSTSANTTPTLTSTVPPSSAPPPAAQAQTITTISNNNNNKNKAPSNFDVLNEKQVSFAVEQLSKEFASEIDQLRRLGCIHFSDEYQKTTFDDELHEMLFDRGSLIIASDLKDLRHKQSTLNKQMFADDDNNNCEKNNGDKHCYLNNSDGDDDDNINSASIMSSQASSAGTNEAQPPATLSQLQKLESRQEKGLATCFGGYSNDEAACIAAKPLQNIAVSNGIAVFVRASGLIDVCDGSSDKILWGNEEMFVQYWLKTTLAVIDLKPVSSEDHVADDDNDDDEKTLQKVSGKRRYREEVKGID